MIGHPVLLLSLFLLVMIEGEHFGGFYILYLFFGLMYLAPFTLLAIAGITTIVIGYNLKSEKQRVKSVLYLIGWLLFIASYLVFFNDLKSNHRETFKTAVPILSFALFGLSSICFLINIAQHFISWLKSKATS